MLITRDMYKIGCIIEIGVPKEKGQNINWSKYGFGITRINNLGNIPVKMWEFRADLYSYDIKNFGYWAGLHKDAEENRDYYIRRFLDVTAYTNQHVSFLDNTIEKQYEYKTEEGIMIYVNICGINPPGFLPRCVGDLGEITPV